MSRIFITNQAFDEERALYGLRGATLSNVSFAGPADGESALKQCTDVHVSDSRFELRYPMWHVNGLKLDGVTLTDSCRAALWYTRHAHITDSELLGIKAVRECEDVRIERSRVVSQEFGWKGRGLSLRDTSIESEYAFLDARDVTLVDCQFSGKYSFQYVENLTVEGGTFDTKDAFWHARNVTVRNATLKGEYLGWYSRNLRLEHCRIEGTQPFVECEGLVLVDCEMVGCDLAFEGCEVEATIIGHVDSIRDPRAGRIELDSVGEIIHDTLGGCGAEIVVRSAKAA